MDGFTYTNIFDTKGIEYLVIISFLLLIIPYWRYLNKPVKAKQAVGKGSLSHAILRFPEGLFFDKNHTWAHLETAGKAKVGLDDLLLHLTGEVKVNYLKKMGDKVGKGEMIACLQQDGKELNITAPVSGEITNMNMALNSNPQQLMADPYQKGWLYKVKPSNWVNETQSLYLGDETKEWSKRELDRFKDFAANTLNKLHQKPEMVSLQTGGELVDHPLSELSGADWFNFQNNFLNT